MNAISIFVIECGYQKQVHLIAMVVIAIAIVMIVIRVLGNIAAKSRITEIKQLERRVDNDYANIKEIIGMEYQKLYDRYPGAGSDRKAISEVQRMLMDNIKKRNAHA